MEVNAGELNQRIQILRHTETRNGAGYLAPPSDPEVVHSCWAKFSRTSGTEVLKAGAEEIIVAHNHPSGNLTPSKADIAATGELNDLARRLGIVFLDHLLIGADKNDEFLSLAEFTGLA